MARSIAWRMGLVCLVLLILIPRSVTYNADALKKMGEGPVLIIADHHILPHDVCGLMLSAKAIRDATGRNTEYVTAHNGNINSLMRLALQCTRGQETVSGHIRANGGGTVKKVLSALTRHNVIVHQMPIQESTGIFHILRGFHGNAYIVRTRWDSEASSWDGNWDRIHEYAGRALMHSLGTTVTYDVTPLPRRPVSGEVPSEYVEYIRYLLYDESSLSH